MSGKSLKQQVRSLAVRLCERLCLTNVDVIRSEVKTPLSEEHSTPQNETERFKC